MTYQCWHWSWSSGWRHICQVLPLYSYCISPPLHTLVFKRSMCSLHLRSGELFSTSLREKCLWIIWDSSACKTCLVPFIYLVNHLSISLWTWYLLYTLVIIQILPYLFCFSNCASFNMHSVLSFVCGVCVCVLSTVLPSGTIRCSRLVYVLFQSWNQPFFLRPWFFSWKMVLETKI